MCSQEVSPGEDVGPDEDSGLGDSTVGQTSRNQGTYLLPYVHTTVAKLKLSQIVYLLP